MSIVNGKEARFDAAQPLARPLSEFPRMAARWLKIGLLLPGALALGACAARSPVASTNVVAPMDVNQSLVATGGELQELALLRSGHSSWEEYRNDRGPGGRELSLYGPWVFLEVRHRDHLSTISGRPREFSSTTTRSIRRELSR